MPTEHAPQRAERSRTFYFAGMLVLFAVYSVAVVAARTFGPALYWVAAASVIAVGFFASSWTSKLDEVVQHAHVQAWFWGGLAGLTFALAGFFALAAARDAGPPTATERAFMAGIMFVIAPMMLGYLAWWAHFWLRRR